MTASIILMIVTVFATLVNSTISFPHDAQCTLYSGGKTIPYDCHDSGFPNRYIMTHQYEQLDQAMSSLGLIFISVLVVSVVSVFVIRYMYAISKSRKTQKESSQ